LGSLFVYHVNPPAGAALDTENHAISISEADLERIAELAVQKVVDKLYLEVGKGVLKRLAWVIGISVVALLMWMGGKGIHLP
jgi:hypothetical protein